MRPAGKGRGLLNHTLPKHAAAWCYDVASNKKMHIVYCPTYPANSYRRGRARRGRAAGGGEAVQNRGRLRAGAGAAASRGGPRGTPAASACRPPRRSTQTPPLLQAQCRRRHWQEEVAPPCSSCWRLLVLLSGRLSSVYRRVGCLSARGCFVCIKYAAFVPRWTSKSRRGGQQRTGNVAAVAAPAHRAAVAGS